MDAVAAVSVIGLLASAVSTVAALLTAPASFFRRGKRSVMGDEPDSYEHALDVLRKYPLAELPPTFVRVLPLLPAPPERE